MKLKNSFIALLIILLSFIQSEKANEKNELEINIYKAKISNSSSKILYRKFRCNFLCR